MASAGFIPERRDFRDPLLIPFITIWRSLKQWWCLPDMVLTFCPLYMWKECR